MDKRKQNGGAREGAGRKPKTEEAQLVEILTPLDSIALSALKDGLDAGEQWAVKLFMEFRWSKPKQQTDITSGGEKLLILPPFMKSNESQS
jgi:hypothetical protein